ncbi:hypothetical protein L4174_020700 [Photobacterium sp. CCB-ST2H9]|uniref:hypothetical protein n=1 Tax=Photobacterium sp. CCB-ST2H9 TaxID=2912855 RepID=UPI002005D1C0|nr:hypothetical protein [Photobacterium sp. CCB-ST2H9]UTM59134.1 hypothetical protein L4174_020700 [Photobacterium sp. CCB-ST2H9]
MMKNLGSVHRIAAITAFVLIASFFSASLMSELFAGQQTVVVVKQLIGDAVWILLLLMAVTGSTGTKLAPGVHSGHGPLGQKKQRMPIVAANGIIVLLPSALYLSHLAALGQFDRSFYWVQSIELTAGAVNLTLMGLNIRDARRFRKGGSV